MKFLEVWHFGEDPKEVLETGKNYVQNVKKVPCYSIVITDDISAKRKIGLLISFYWQSKKWFQLTEDNMGDDLLYKAVLNNNFPFLYIKGYGVWKVVGLCPYKKFTTIEITKFEEN